MAIGNGIAVAGIWLGVGITSWGFGGDYIIALSAFACIATMFASG